MQWIRPWDEQATPPRALGDRGLLVYREQGILLGAVFKKTRDPWDSGANSEKAWDPWRSGAIVKKTRDQWILRAGRRKAQDPSDRPRMRNGSWEATECI
ncbi:hypothetical protein NDU88_002920 [Pleurodeles waltl]|uniref:Uncharacterized protein n=1 Tax=Pleurodeles waltl TaxID=8319 RepID=A0AAV7QE79_PLEWA|nr:hypothetical protein NDU88_002920 [Pleurodeles waltl]